MTVCGLHGENHKFKARHVVCIGRMGVWNIISSPQHSKDDGIQNINQSVVL